MAPKIRQAKAMPDKYKFATPAEIANRATDKGGFDPESNAPAFVQVKPGNTGADAAHPSGSQRTNGNFYR